MKKHDAINRGLENLPAAVGPNGMKVFPPEALGAILAAAKKRERVSFTPYHMKPARIVARDVANRKYRERKKKGK